MCSGRVDLEFILRAFMNGQDGVMIGGCKLDECNYVTHGNYDALANTYICKKLLQYIGLNPDRLAIQFMSGADGNLLAEVCTDFVKQIRGMGRIGEAEDIAPEEMKLRLEAVSKMVPYIRLVERERMRQPLKTREAYHQFYTSETFEKLFRDLIADKLDVALMTALLREKPRTTPELAQKLRLSPSEVSRHLNAAAKQGLVSFDEKQNIIAAAYYPPDADEAAVSDVRSRVRPAALDNAKVDQIIEQHKGMPGALIHVLMEVQSENRWLPKEILDRISRQLAVPLRRVMQIASFYKTFSLTPKGRHEVHVCMGTACHLRGATDLLGKVQELIGVRPGEVDADANFSLDTGNCLGCCTLGPEIIVDGKHYGRTTPDEAESVLKNYS